MPSLKKFWSSIKRFFTQKQKPIQAPVQPEQKLPTGTNEKCSWLDIAKAELGESEIPGVKNNAQIEEYHAATTLGSSADEVPWCSSFVSWCLQKAGMKSTRSAWAKSYLSYGTKLKDPKVGCVVILSRGANSGHVGFFVKSNLFTVTLLGGNQSNCVCYADYPKWRVLGYRWPHA